MTKRNGCCICGDTHGLKSRRRVNAPANVRDGKISVKVWLCQYHYGQDESFDESDLNNAADLSALIRYCEENEITFWTNSVDGKVEARGRESVLTPLVEMWIARHREALVALAGKSGGR